MLLIFCLIVFIYVASCYSVASFVKLCVYVVHLHTLLCLSNNCDSRLSLKFSLIRKQQSVFVKYKRLLLCFCFNTQLEVEIHILFKLHYPLDRFNGHCKL